MIITVALHGLDTLNGEHALIEYILLADTIVEYHNHKY